MSIQINFTKLLKILGVFSILMSGTLITPASARAATMYSQPTANVAHQLKARSDDRRCEFKVFVFRWLQPLECQILEQVVERLYPFWPSANLMAGAGEIAAVDRYFTARAAAEVFGEATGRFHGYPAKFDRLTQLSNGHYQDARWIEWLAGRRIFRVRTSYNSTYPGEARDPAIIAEVLFDVAVRFGLLTDEVPPITVTPYPTAPDVGPTPTSIPSSPVREQ
jgi:hypothetical protein